MLLISSAVLEKVAAAVPLSPSQVVVARYPDSSSPTAVLPKKAVPPLSRQQERFPQEAPADLLLSKPRSGGHHSSTPRLTTASNFPRAFSSLAKSKPPHVPAAARIRCPSPFQCLTFPAR